MIQILDKLIYFAKYRFFIKSTMDQNMIVENESSLHKKCVLYLNIHFIFFALLCKIVCF
jgi:hypothetical protein